jgi:hypothetical protein
VQQAVAGGEIEPVEVGHDVALHDSYTRESRRRLHRRA